MINRYAERDKIYIFQFDIRLKYIHVERLILLCACSCHCRSLQQVSCLATLSYIKGLGSPADKLAKFCSKFDLFQNNW